MRNLLNRVRAMFGFKAQPAPIVTPATHAADMRESAERRHKLVGEQAELERRLYFLSLEARADAGWQHGYRQTSSHHPG